MTPTGVEFPSWICKGRHHPACPSRSGFPFAQRELPARYFMEVISFPGGQGKFIQGNQSPTSLQSPPVPLCSPLTPAIPPVTEQACFHPRVFARTATHGLFSLSFVSLLNLTLRSYPDPISCNIPSLCSLFAFSPKLVSPSSSP